MNLNDFNERAEKSNGAVSPQYRASVISVHGMNTRASWQKTLATCMQDACIRHVAVDFGTTRMRALFPGNVKDAVAKIVASHKEQQLHHKCVCAIAHSMGSLAIATALNKYPELTLDRIILIGSILPCDYNWNFHFSRKQVESVLNEVCPKDRWVRFAGVIWGHTGQSGRKGFSRRKGNIRNLIYRDTGHSGLLHELHFNKVWVPFITQGRIIKTAR